MRPSGLRLDIQGLRAVAVLLVVLYHADLPGLPGGYVGVDVFFVVSGFLMTAHLLRPLVNGGHIRFGDFYARRIKRLLPASLTVLVVTLIAALIVLPPLRSFDLAKDAAASALYVPNWWFAALGTDYLTEDVPSPFQHYWSLGVEEQFYLVWPLLIAGLWVVGRKKVKCLAWAIGAISLGSLLVGVWMTENYGPWAFFLPFSRAWEFGAGALAAILVTTIGDRQTMSRPAAAFLSWVGLAGILAAGVIYDDTTAFPGTAALLPVVATALVLLASSDDNAVSAASLLKRRPLTKIGDWSYSLYLWHWPVIIIPAMAYPGIDWRVKLLLAAACFPLAALTYRYIEEPGRKSRLSRALPPGRSIVAAAAVGVTAATASIVVGHGLDNRLIASDREAPVYVAGAAVELTGYVPANGTVRLQEANTDVPLPYTEGCSPGDFSSTLKVCRYGKRGSDRQYVLWGDSHAAQWFSAALQVATKDGAELVVLNKSRCASIDVARYVQGGVDQYCEDWKADALDYISDNKPELVMISNLHVRTGKDGANITAAEWASGTMRTLRKMPETTQVAVIADTPWFSGDSPPMCASANVNNLAKCYVDRDEVIDSEWIELERAAVEAADQHFVDMTDAYCTRTTCGPYVGPHLVYRDSHHLTDTFVAALAPRFARLLNGQRSST